VQIEFDPAKDRINLEKHGISLAATADVDLDSAIIIEDVRSDYGGTRFLAYAPITRCLHVRVIGLRRANRRERKKHGQAG
jgi:uncharacterized DUF497 family protein